MINKNISKDDKEILNKAIRDGGYYGSNGIWNSIVKIPGDNHLYRARVETIIVRDKKEIFMKLKPNGEYFLPGGSKEKDIPDIDQAVNECREEARINVRNIESTGITYKTLKNLTSYNNKSVLNCDGYITDIYIAEYDSVYKGPIAKEDKDPFILSGKFYSTKKCLKFFKKEHREALMWYLKNHVGGQEIITESKFSDNIDSFIHNNINTPNDLYSWMNENIKDTTSNYLKSPNEVYKSLSGDSHDQTLFAIYVLNRIHYEHGSLFVFELDNNNNLGIKHSIPYYIENGKYYWMENVWVENTGIKGPYNSIEELKNSIKHKWGYNGYYPNLLINDNEDNMIPLIDKKEFYELSIKKYEERVEKVSNEDNPIYLINKENLDNRVVIPKIPDNYFTQQGYEDGITRRIVFNSNINDGLKGITGCNEGDKLYIHVPVNKCTYYIPSINESPECKITKEVWVRESTRVKCIGEIILEEVLTQGYKFKYGKNKTGELYEWIWEWTNNDYTEDNDMYTEKNNYFMNYVYERKVKLIRVVENLLKDSTEDYEISPTTKQLFLNPNNSILKKDSTIYGNRNRLVVSALQYREIGRLLMLINKELVKEGLDEDFKAVRGNYNLIYIEVDLSSEIYLESMRMPYYFEAPISTEKRNSLEDSEFGIPELRKYPLDTKERVKSAIRFFNYVDSEHEEELAKNIFKAMKKFNISVDIIGPKNRLSGYVEKYGI